MIAVNMPQVGQDIPTARIVEWTKKEGDEVSKGEVLAIVESDKATFEVQATHAGVLLKIEVAAGEEGEVFKPIAWIGQPGEPSVQEGGHPDPLSQADRIPRESQPTEVAEDKGDSRRQPASPSARRLASERGVDLRSVKGTGPGGRILREDVLAAAEAAAACAAARQPDAAHQASPGPTGDDEIVPFSRMRQRIAERLTLSQHTIPHFHLAQEVDMTEAQQWRQWHNAANGSHVTVTDLIICATARALVDFPRLNAHVHRDRLLLRKQVNVGVATAVDEGLLVPVIPETDRKSLEEISRLSKQVAEAARRGVVDPSVQGTFTVSSLGQFGVPFFLPIINPPECGILAVGAVQPRVVAVAGGIGVRQMMSLNLGCDHRAVDGAYAAGFLRRLKELLETTWRAGDK